ncbi:unnamed protein product [Closterium sp. NIES-53]
MPGRCQFLHYPPVSGGSVRLTVRSSPPLVLYELGSSLYTLSTEPPQVATSAQVSASGQIAASCSCRLLSHHTLLWHHRLGHPSLPRLRGMHSRLLVSGLPRSRPPLPPSPAPPCLPCVEGRQRAAPHSSSFPLTTAPLQTLHMDVWGPAYVSGQGRERYFLLVIDDYTRYTTVFPLRSKGEDLPVLRLHSDRGGEFSSDLLRDFCRGEGITPSFTLSDSPQQNGIAERRIGLVMEFYHPTLHRVLPSQDVTFDESVPFYRLFPYRSAPSPPPPLFLAPGPPPVAVVPGAAPGAASGGAASGGAEPGGAGSEGAGSGGAEPEGVEPGGAELEGAEPEGTESEGAEFGGAEPQGVASSRGPAAGEPGDVGAGGAADTTGAGDPTEPGAAGAGGAGAGVAGVGGPGAGGARGAGARAVDPGAGGTVRPRPYFVPLLQKVLGVTSSTGLPPPFLSPPTDQSQPPLQPASLLPVPSPYTEQSGGLTERREPASRPVSPVCTARRAPRSRPPPVPDTHTMAFRPFSVPLRVPLPAPPESSLRKVPDPESDRAHAASPTFACFLATAITDPSFESAAASALVAELLDFASACRLDYAFARVAESVPASPPSVGDPDAPDIPTPRSYTEAITGPYSSQWQAAMDAEMASWKSTGTYRVDYFQTFSPTPKMTTLWVLLHVAAQRDYELHSLDFSTAFLQGSPHEEIWLRRPPGFTGSFPTRTQWSLRRPVYGLRQAPCEWHDTIRTTLVALGFVPSTADPSLFLRTDTSLPPFYVLVYVDDLVFATADTEALTLVKSFSASASSTPHHSSLLCLPATRSQLHLQTSPTSGMGLVLGGRGPVVLTGHVDASWVDDSTTQRSSQGYTFSLGSGSELCWLTYLLIDLGEQPRSPPVLYVDNKAMIALCQKHRQEHRTKHIALQYFLARELQQRGQLRLAYVATRANTADVFTKAVPPGDHQRFVTVLGLLALLCFFS